MFDQKAASAAIVSHARISNASGAQLIDPQLPAPNFFIVGAVKAGTTSLHAYLRQHPQVFMPQFKEPHYFASFVEVRPEFDNFEPVLRDPRQYQELFRGSAGYKAVGEASPSYLCDGHAAMRIKSAIPNAKIIISLRNPVERAYSHYLMEYREGRKRPFREALEVDEARTDKGWGVSFEYVEMGLYAEQVERYLDAFGRSNVLVILFEDFIRRTPAVMQEVARFLDVDPALFPPSAFEGVHNPFDASRGRLAQWILRRRWLRVWGRRLVPRQLRKEFRLRFLITTKSKKPRLEEDTRRWLAERFAPDLQRLERLLGRDLGALRSIG